jgi:hypothetical protein
MTTADSEFSPTTMIHPYITVLNAEAETFTTTGVRQLFEKLDVIETFAHITARVTSIFALRANVHTCCGYATPS